MTGLVLVLVAQGLAYKLSVRHFLCRYIDQLIKLNLECEWFLYNIYQIISFNRMTYRRVERKAKSGWGVGAVEDALFIWY